MGSFKPHDTAEAYSTVSHGDLSLYVSASRVMGCVRLNGITDHNSASIRLTAERARELAAELIAAADSLQTVAEAA